MKSTKIINFTQAMNRVQEIENEIKWLDWDERKKLVNICRPLSSMIKNIKSTKFFPNTQRLNINGTLTRLEYAFSKEGRILLNMRQNSSQGDKSSTVYNIKRDIHYDLIEVKNVLANIIS